MKYLVQEYIEKNQILHDEDVVVLAVSGGADSMALAHFMVTNYPNHRYIVAHVNHGLRKDAQVDADLVGRFANENGLDFALKYADIKTLAKKRKQGIEETGREIRYAFFRSLGGDLILTAHHKDDFAETILAHMIRGCGIKGLCGILPKEKDLGRPFLCVTKEELLNYCCENKISYIIDESNDDTVFMRNKIRHELLPLLGKFNPNAVEALYRLGNLAYEDEMVLMKETKRVFDTTAEKEQDTISLPNSMLNGLEKGLQRRLVVQAMENLGHQANYDIVEKALSLKTGKELPVGKEGRIIQNGQKLIFCKKGEICIDPPNFYFSTTGFYETSWGTLQVEEVCDRQKGSKNVLLLPKTVLEQGLTLRSWSFGDWFSLSGGGRKKISDFFIDEKIPKEQRKWIPLVTLEDQVFMVFGYRNCFSYPNCKNTVKITCKN